MTKTQATEYIENHFKNFEGTWGHQDKLKYAIELLIVENDCLLKGNRALVQTCKDLAEEIQDRIIEDAGADI